MGIVVLLGCVGSKIVQRFAIIIVFTRTNPIHNENIIHFSDDPCFLFREGFECWSSAVTVSHSLESFMVLLNGRWAVTNWFAFRAPLTRFLAGLFVGSHNLHRN